MINIYLLDPRHVDPTFGFVFVFTLWFLMSFLHTPEGLGIVVHFPSRQIRLVKSTVHLTGSPSSDTKQRLVELLAPSKSEVVATTTAASCHSRSGSYTSMPSISDLPMLEMAEHRTVSLQDYLGALRDESDNNGEGKKEERDSEFSEWWGGEDRRSGFGVAASLTQGSPISRRGAQGKAFRGSSGSYAEYVEVCKVFLLLGAFFRVLLKRALLRGENSRFDILLTLAICNSTTNVFTIE